MGISTLGDWSIRSPRSETAGGCESSDMVAENQTLIQYWYVAVSSKMKHPILEASLLRGKMCYKQGWGGQAWRGEGQKQCML